MKMSVVLEIVSDSPDEDTPGTLDCPDEKRVMTPTSDLDYSLSCDEDDEIRAKKMLELKDYVTVTAAAMAKRTRRKMKRDPGIKPCRREIETDESDRYLKKIKTLQQNKRRQETRIKKLAGDVKVLKDKITIQASYIDVLCGMLTPELRERFRGRQGLGILGNALPEPADPDEPAQPISTDVGEGCEANVLEEKEDDLLDMNEEDGKFHCIEDLTEQQSDGKSITEEGEQGRISKDFGEGHSRNLKMIPPAGSDSQANTIKQFDGLISEISPAQLVDAVESTSNNNSIPATEDKQVTEMDGNAETDSGLNPVKIDDEVAESPGGLCAQSEQTSPKQQTDSSCDSTKKSEQISATDLELKNDVEMDEDDSKHLEQADQKCTADLSLQPDTEDKTLLADSKNDPETPLSEDASLKTGLAQDSGLLAKDASRDDEASKYPSDETQRTNDPMDSVISDYPAIASATIDDFLAEYAPHEEKYASMDVAMPGPSNVPVASIPPVSLSVPIVSIPSSSLSVPIVTVPQPSRITKPLPRLTMRGRRNPRRRCTFRTRPIIPALRNEHLIQQDYSMAGISPLEFCSKYEFSPHHSNVTQQFRHPASSPVGNFLQAGNLPVQRLPLGSAAFEGIMAGYQNPQPLCIAGLDGSIPRGNVPGTVTEEHLSDIVMAGFGEAAKFNNV